MEYTLSNELKTMVKSLMELYDIAYLQIKPNVEYIVDNDIKDLNIIEHTLETLLDIPTNEGYNLFVKLCNYMSKFNKELADEYLEIYDDLYGEAKPKTKKKL